MGRHRWRDHSPRDGGTASDAIKKHFKLVMRSHEWLQMM